MEAPLKTLSKLQLDNFDRFYRHDDEGLTSAFAAFGQGILFDPRRAPDESEVHTMNGNPPNGYHFWHAIQRAQMLLDIDRRRWARINPMLGFAWALQSIAKPDHRHVNPGAAAGPGPRRRALLAAALARAARPRLPVVALPGQHPLIRRLQRRARRDPEPLVEDAPAPVVDGDRVRRAAARAQRGHEQRPRALP